MTREAPMHHDPPRRGLRQILVVVLLGAAVALAIPLLSAFTGGPGA